VRGLMDFNPDNQSNWDVEKDIEEEIESEPPKV
jgi:hypothetical protein